MDRRSIDRHDVARPANVTPVNLEGDLEPSLNATFVDISRGGACLLVPRMLHPGSRVVVEARATSAQFIEAARVRWTRYEVEKGVLVGVEFERSPVARKLIEQVLRTRRAA